MQISNEIINVLDYLGNKIGVTIDWTSTNVLPYIEDLCSKFIKWEVEMSIAWIVIASVMAILSLVFAIFVDMDGFQWVLFTCAVVVAIIVIGTQVFDIITCNTFPEKVIYDYIKQIYSNSR